MCGKKAFFCLSLTIQTLNCDIANSQNLLKTDLNSATVAQNFKKVSSKKITSMIEKNNIGAGIIEFDCFYNNSSNKNCDIVHQLRNSFSINNIGVNLIFFGNRVYSVKEYPTLIFFIKEDDSICNIEASNKETIVYFGKSLNRKDVFSCIEKSLEFEFFRKTGLRENIIDLIAYDYALDELSVGVSIESSVKKINSEFERILK